MLKNNTPRTRQLSLPRSLILTTQLSITRHHILDNESWKSTGQNIQCLGKETISHYINEFEFPSSWDFSTMGFVPESGGNEDMGEWFAGLEKSVNRMNFIERGEVL